MHREKINIKKLLKSFTDELEKDIEVNEIILFGSYAKGHENNESDIDVIVVSPSFNKGTYIKNMQYLFRKAIGISSLLEPIPAAPAEIKHADKRTFLGQALKESRVFKF